MRTTLGKDGIGISVIYAGSSSIGHNSRANAGCKLLIATKYLLFRREGAKEIRPKHNLRTKKKTY
jgi:hypothetical protein